MTFNWLKESRSKGQRSSRENSYRYTEKWYEGSVQHIMKTTGLLRDEIRKVVTNKGGKTAGTDEMVLKTIEMQLKIWQRWWETHKNIMLNHWIPKANSKE